MSSLVQSYVAKMGLGIIMPLSLNVGAKQMKAGEF